MNLDQVMIADDKSEVTNFSGTVLFVGDILENKKGKSKTRQTISVGESKEKSMWVTIWDGKFDRKILGAKAVIAKGTMEVYEGKRRISITSNNITITDIPTPKAETPATQTTPQAVVQPGQVGSGQTVTGSVSKPVVPEVLVELPDVKTQIDGLLAYYTDKLTKQGFTTDNIMSIVATCFIEINKRARKERY
jgi:hypothetical protein